MKYIYNILYVQHNFNKTILATIRLECLFHLKQLIKLKMQYKLRNYFIKRGLWTKSRV